MKNNFKTIAVMTSGGDAPGMNAAIRAVVRTAIVKGINVLAINGGYEGMIDGNFSEMNAESVGNIIHKGGTIIYTSRSERFRKPSWRKVAHEQLQKNNIDAVIIIGGNGSFAGAATFTSEFKIPFIGIPKTIDNDVFGTDYAIGFDTAINTALDALDKIRDTANSHHRLFFVEVMGRDLGFLALYSGIAAGAEAILVPEIKTNMEDLIALLEKGWQRKKNSMIVVVAEGAVKGGVMNIAEQVKMKFNHFDIRVSILGHIQRGGNPSCFDRVLASQLGNHSIQALLKGKKNVVIGMKNNKISYTSFAEASSYKHTVDQNMLQMANELTK